MGRKIGIPGILILLSLTFSCKGLLIKPESVHSLNQDWEPVVFSVRDDLYAGAGKDSVKDILFRKGEKVKIYMESGPDWVRIKAYGATENREQARARTIIYVFREDVPENEDILVYLPKKLNEKVSAEKTPEKKPTGKPK